MEKRNLSPQQMFFQLALENKPKYSFNGQEFWKWKEEAITEVLACLGDYPERVPLNPELIAEWKDDGLRKQRWMIDVSRHISAAFQINMPYDIPDGQKLPGIMCWHGHGIYGKDSVMRNIGDPGTEAEIRQLNYDFGRQMAKNGYITFAIDWIGMGERNDSAKPHFLPSAGHDWCDAYYLHATMLGMTSLSINITHGVAATDFACSFPQLDADRLGVMGISGGGTMTLWSALCDRRFKAAEIICYSDLWAYFGIHDLNYCGMQVAPGLFKLVDVPDLQGLLAPKPLLVDIGVHDECFKVDNSLKCFKRVKRVYEAAGASDRLELDLFPGGHAWGGNKSVSFFGKYI